MLKSSGQQTQQKKIRLVSSRKEVFSGLWTNFVQCMWTYYLLYSVKGGVIISNSMVLRLISD